MNVANYLVGAAAAALAVQATAQEQRSGDAHEHGHGILNIAIEGDQIAMELEAPGFDIVGFEHVAESDSDLAAVEAALEMMSNPLILFTFPEMAGCETAEHHAEMLIDGGHDDEEGHEEHEHDDDEGHEEHEHDDEEGHEGHGHDDDEGHEEHGHDDEEGHEEHGHDDEEGHEEHGHDDEEGHEEHGHDDEEGHEEHGHDDEEGHEEHGHDDEEGHEEHGHDDEEGHEEHGHDGGATHSEFRAEYLLTCSDIDSATRIDLSYFELFQNAESLTVQIVTAQGAALTNGTRENATIDLSDAMRN